MSRIDLAVLGGGSAGFAAAIRAAEKGANVALINHGVIGGTCVNVGCVPSKALIRSAEAVHKGRAHPFKGIPRLEGSVDWPSVRVQKDELVERLRQAKYVDVLEGHPKITFIEGRGTVEAGGAVALEGGARIETDRVVVTTGSSPAVPDIPGLSEVGFLDSTEVQELGTLPDSLAVIGSGSVGLELGQAFARLGVRVTILARSTLLSREDPQLGRGLASYLIDEGIGVHEHFDFVRVEMAGDRRAVIGRDAEGGEVRVEAEALLVATGRRPNTSGLGLDAAGVELGPRGEIKVDEYGRTTNPNIYAAGDVTGDPMYVYVAARAGAFAAENALSEASLRLDLSVVPRVTFTDPSVAVVGLTEAAALGGGFDPITSVLPMEHVPRSLAAHDMRGFVKLVADAGTRRILGAAILAPEAVEMIMEPTLAVKHRLTVEDLVDTMHPYLTFGEGIRLAAQTFDKEVAALSCCAA